MTDLNYNKRLLILLLGLAPACIIGDKNLGEDDGETENDTSNGDGDGDEGDGDGDEGDGDGDGEPTTCGDGIEDPNELCFEVISLVASDPVLDVEVHDVNAGGENGFDDIVVLTTNGAAPFLIWHSNEDEEGGFEAEPLAVAGTMAAPVIPGLEIGDFDPGGIEYFDFAYATADGVVIGWDQDSGPNGAFDDFTLIECPNPLSFALGNFDGDSQGGPDVICAREAGPQGIEVLLASNLGARNFASAVPVGSDLTGLTPLHGTTSFTGFVAHDRDDELIVWEFLGDEYLYTSYPVDSLAWDVSLIPVAADAELTVVSHDPQGLLPVHKTPEGDYEAGELIATDALPFGLRGTSLFSNTEWQVLATLGSGHLSIWPVVDQGLAEPTLIEVGPDPREIAVGAYGWTAWPFIAVTNSDNTVSLLVPDP